MAVMNDPSSGASTTVLAELINVYAILLFFAMDGHLLLVSVLYKGFTYWYDRQRAASANPAYHRTGL